MRIYNKIYINDNCVPLLYYSRVEPADTDELKIAIYGVVHIVQYTQSAPDSTHTHSVVHPADLSTESEDNNYGRWSVVPGWSRQT